MSYEDFDIEPVLRHYGYDGAPLGSVWQSLLCLFHEESRKSARANQTGYRCLSCGVGGDAIKLLMERENVDFDRALEIYQEVAERSGYPVPQSATRKRRRGLSPFREEAYERGSGLFSDWFRR